MRHHPLYLVFSLAFLLQACSEAHFFGLARKSHGSGGSSPVPKEPVPQPPPPSMPENPTEPEKADAPAPQKADNPAPQKAGTPAKEGLALVFVVDLFTERTPAQTPEQKPASPASQGETEVIRCLKTSDVMDALNKLEAFTGDASDVFIGLVPFVGRLVTEAMIPPTPFADFAARADAGSFCVQSPLNHL